MPVPYELERTIMDAHTLASLRRGLEVGLVASVPQVLGTHLERKMLKLPEGSANIGPEFIRRLGVMTRKKLSEEVRWLGASAFHFGYAAFWGALYGLAYKKRPVHPVVGGLLMAGAIYAVAFPRWGGATRTQTTPPPRWRDWHMELLLATPPLIFGLGTSLLYGRGPRHGEDVLAEEMIEEPIRHPHAA